MATEALSITADGLGVALRESVEAFLAGAIELEELVRGVRLYGEGIERGRRDPAWLDAAQLALRHPATSPGHGLGRA